MSPQIAIVGAGPAGCMAACQLDKSFDITIFDKSSPLKTLLPTGGGRCNLAHNELDFKELAKNYPRGEKFLYSVFSRFGTQETLDFFEKIGLKTYSQDNGRIFPISNNSQDVRQKILNTLHHCKFIKEEILDIKKSTNGFSLKSNKANYFFDIVIIAIGGKNSYSIMKDTNHTIISPKPSLIGLKTNPCLKTLQGLSLKNCVIKSEKNLIKGDILFTNDGISGPAIFELSSINARKELPYKIEIDFLNREIDWQTLFDKNPHKNLKNLISEILPKSFVNEIFKDINLTQKCCEVKSNTKELINKYLNSYEFLITGTRNHGETVTCGGISLKEINSKTMESKIINNLYIIGEVLDIDGYCGGYNLQSCWSTGAIAGFSINSKIIQLSNKY